MSQNMSEKKLLLQQSARLYTLGLQVEKARENLRDIVYLGFAYDSMEVLRALDAFNCLQIEWNELEQKHLALRRKLEYYLQESSIP